jgi:hypothetical protein
MRSVFLGLIGSFVFAMSALAELPAIRFDRMTPLGVAAGEAVEVEVVGNDLEGLHSLRFDQPGLTAEAITGKERWFRITAAADVPAGTYDVRLVGRFGVSSSKLLAVQHGLSEVLEIEPNNDAAQQVQVNCVVNGTSDGENIDRFRFTAKAGQRIVLDIDAQLLDSMLDGQLLLLNDAGKQLASSGDYHGRDPLIDFVIPADGDYVAVIHDLSYRGGYPYRLAITDRPHVENVFPRAIQRGQTADVIALGRNLGAPQTATVGDTPLESVKVSIAAPSPSGSYSFLNHPTDHSVLPTGATFQLEGFQARPAFSTGESLTPVTMLLCDSPVSLESEPSVKEAPQVLAIPAVVSGRFDERGDADWFEFMPAEDGQIAIEVYAERLAAQADPYFIVVDEQGNRVQEFDDYGHRINAFDAHLRDPVGSVNVQKNKKYRVLVQDRYQRGGPRFQYVLTMSKPQPQVFAGVIHRENPQPAGLNLWSGGATWLDVVLHREGGSTPVTLTAEGLPPGMHFLPTTIPNDTRGAFVLWSDEGAAPWTGAIKLYATYHRGEQQIKQEVRSYTRVWNDAKGTSRPTRELAAAICERAPFFVTPEKDRVEVKGGDKLELRVQIKRLWPEFTSELKLLPLTFPGGLQMPEIVVPAGGNEAVVAITVQNGMQPGDYTVALQAQAQVPFNKDASAKDKSNTLVSMPSRPFRIAVQKSEK